MQLNPVNNSQSFQARIRIDKSKKVKLLKTGASLAGTSSMAFGLFSWGSAPESTYESIRKLPDDSINGYYRGATLQDMASFSMFIGGPYMFGNGSHNLYLASNDNELENIVSKMNNEDDRKLPT